MSVAETLYFKSAGSEFFAMPIPDERGAINYALRVPKGVIAVVCPWNLPLLLMTWKAAPALTCGNTVVVKPSEKRRPPPLCWARS